MRTDICLNKSFCNIVCTIKEIYSSAAGISCTFAAETIILLNEANTILTFNFFNSTIKRLNNFVCKPNTILNQKNSY